LALCSFDANVAQLENSRSVTRFGLCDCEIIAKLEQWSGAPDLSSVA
jgi:hypothetical protein